MSKSRPHGPARFGKAALEGREVGLSGLTATSLRFSPLPALPGSNRPSIASRMIWVTLV